MKYIEEVYVVQQREIQLKKYFIYIVFYSLIALFFL